MLNTILSYYKPMASINNSPSIRQWLAVYMHFPSLKSNIWGDSCFFPARPVAVVLASRLDTTSIFAAGMSGYFLKNGESLLFASSVWRHIPALKMTASLFCCMKSWTSFVPVSSIIMHTIYNKINGHSNLSKEIMQSNFAVPV